MCNVKITETETLFRVAKNLGANVNQEDEAIAYCLTRPEEDVWAPAFARLHSKYHEIVRGYLDHRHTELSATGKDVVANMTFDRIRQYSTQKPITPVNGSLGSFVTLVCEWEAQKVSRTEKRRSELLTKKLQELWCLQRDESDQYQGNAITDQDVEELMAAIRKTIDSERYPNTILVLQAISAIYVNTGGLQIEGCERNPSVGGIKRYLETINCSLSEEDIRQSLKALRSRAKRILEENGWEIECPVTKFAK